MSLVLNSTPLAAITAVAVDTETTGLDAAVDHVIELAAFGLTASGPDGHSFASLVASPVPVPPSSTAIHGLGNADLANAPDFAAIWPEFAAFVAGRVWIGHTIGFDLAVLRKAAQRAGCAWAEPATLDVRLLAQALGPRLPDTSLDTLCDWLGIARQGRHRALADAEMAGRVFMALLPRLRARQITTLGDAIGICRRLSEGSVWPINVPSAGAEAALGETRDTYPYRHRVGDVMSRDPRFLASETPLLVAIRIMTEARISSVFVGQPTAPASQIGILTERDTMRALAQGGALALDRPISAFATKGLTSIAVDAFLYRAIGRMARHRIRHLAVTDEDGGVVGAVSARDLLKLRASAAVELGDDLDVAPDIATLGRAWARIPAMAQALLDEDMSAREISGIVAAEVCAATARAAYLAEAAMVASGAGRAPCPFAVLVLGSAGRGESLLAMDQDNALVFETGEPGGPEDAWFAAFGARLADTLDQIGIPLCKGGVMASQPAYRGSLATWRSRIQHWLSRSNPEDLLSVDIWFDLRPVYGAAVMAGRLRAEAWEAAGRQKAFLKLLAAQGAHAESPRGLLGGWRTGPDQRIDLKNAGLRRIVSAGRVLAMAGGHLAYSTHERWSALAAEARRDSAAGNQADFEDIDRAHGVILDVILRQQIEDLKIGLPLTNRIDPAKLDRIQARRLKAAISHAGVIDELVRDRLTG